MNQKVELPVPVLKTPHWRVNFRPSEYNDNLINSLGKCFEIIEKTKLHLRGWDYPHLSWRDTERDHGINWVASWSDFGENNEYWRFYQSGQFLHLFSVREAVEQEWQEKLKSEMRGRFSGMDTGKFNSIPCFICIINFIYQITEIYEFAARLCETQTYTDNISIKIELKGIKEFALAPPSNFMRFGCYKANRDNLPLSNDYKSDLFMAYSRNKAVSSIAWFFERFGWLSPPLDTIRHYQENFLAGKF